MNLLTALKLGRVSNLPTVWSNVLAGVTLANVDINPLSVVIVIVAMSLVYTAGMFFNDVFDQNYDREHRPDRPIPAGEANPAGVTWWAATMMVSALLLIALNTAVTSWYPVFACAVLCVLVIFYDWRHKNNPFGPLIMGLCRGMVYITAAFSFFPEFSFLLLISASSITVWVLGLTMVAKKKNLLGGFLVLTGAVIGVLFSALNQVLVLYEFIVLAALSITLVYGFVFRCKQGKYWNSVTLLIASICLLDAMVIVSVTGSFYSLAIVSVGLFFVTLVFQRFIEGS